MTSAKLFLLGTERDLLWVDTNYYRHVGRDGSPSSNLEGGLLRLSFVSQESDDVFWHNMVKKVDKETERMEKGEIHFYSKGNEDSAIRKYKFNDAYLIEFTEIFNSWGTENMQIILTISPAIQNYGYSHDFVKYWQVSALPTQPIYYQPKEETEDRIIYINGHFYNKDGTFEGKINEPDFEGSVEDVYVCDGKSTQKNKNGNDLVTYNNTKKLDITHEVLLAFASVIHAESSGSKNESYAIGNVTMNFINDGGSRQIPTLEDAVMYDNNFAQGATQDYLSIFKDLDDRNTKFAMGAAINAIANSQGIPGFIDYSGGANGWDGIDLISSKWSNSHRGYTWSEDSKELLLTYKKDNNGGVDVSKFTYKKDEYQISATKIIDKTIYTNITTGRGEKKQSKIRFHL